MLLVSFVFVTHKLTGTFVKRTRKIIIFHSDLQ